MTTTYHYNWI